MVPVELWHRAIKDEIASETGGEGLRKGEYYSIEVQCLSDDEKEI